MILRLRSGQENCTRCFWIIYKNNEEVHPTGYVINFPREKSDKIEKGFDKKYGVITLFNFVRVNYQSLFLYLQ